MKGSVGTIREQISLDIDRLIYSSSDFENLLSKLKERGYEIKRGKHLAVKAPFAERFVRLKSLGEKYLPTEIEKRIAEKDKFPNSAHRKISKCSEIEKKVCVTILETTVAIQQLRIIPRKTKPNKIYVYQNDETINRLAEQLRTISEFGISSRDGIMNKISELKESIDRKNDEIKSLSDELPTLKSDIRQLHFFFDRLSSQVQQN